MRELAPARRGCHFRKNLQRVEVPITLIDWVPKWPMPCPFVWAEDSITPVREVLQSIN